MARIAMFGMMLFAFPLSSTMAQNSNVTQGVVSLTPKESRTLADYYKGKSDEASVLDKIVRDAEKAMQKEPAPLARIITSGASVKTGKASNSKEAEEESGNIYTLALAYAITGKEVYFEKASHYLLSWAQVNQPEGDSVAEVKFVPMIRAYDLIRNRLAPADRERIDHWMIGVGRAVLAYQEEARAKNSPRGINNHRSHALLIIAVIGCAIGEQNFIHYVTDKSGFLDHIGENLATFTNEPPGAGVDYHERKAYHYVAYNLQALGQLAIVLDRMRHLSNNPYGITYNPYTIEVKGVSPVKTLRLLLPYATGEKRNMTEFEGTDNKNDLKRLENGSLHREFNRKDAIPALEAANYFFLTVPDPTTVHSYNLTEITTDILIEEKGRLSLPRAYPTPAFLVNRVTSPYLSR